MASNRDVKLTLSIDTLGEDQITALQKAISDLAKKGGDAAPEFQKLADEVGRLGDQAGALGALRSLTDELEQIKVKQTDAAQRSQDYAQKLTELKAATDAAKASQAGIKDEIVQQQTALVEAGYAIKTLKNEYDVAARKSNEYKTALQQQLDIQKAADLSLVQLRQSLSEANTQVTQAESAQSKVQTAYSRTEAEIQRLNAALTSQGQKVAEAAQAAEKLGVETQNIAQAEGTLLAALNSTGAAAQKKDDDLKAAAKAAAELAESDRLLAIQERTLADLYQRGANALLAEEEAQRSAAAAVRSYEQAKQQAAADQAAWQREADAIVNAAQAAEQMRQKTIAQVEAQRQLEASQAFEEQYRQMRRMLDASAAFDELAARERAAAAAAEQLQSAFNTLNVRSAEAIKNEIQQTRAAMETLRTSATTAGQSLAGAFASGESKIKALELELRTLQGELTTADRLSKLFSNSMGQITAGNLLADGIGYLVNKVKEMGAAFVTTLVETDKMRRGLNAVYKDVEVTSGQIEFLRKTSLAAGVSMGSLQSDFVKYAAATKAANIPLQVTNDLFVSLTKASGALGLSGEEVSGMLNALGQMASKGTVQMEELRGQLGDRLPGALSLTANGLGITEAQLIKLVEAGGLAFRDFAPAMTQALKSMAGETTGLSSTWENLKTTLTTTAQAAGDAGWTQVLTLGLKGLTAIAAGIVLPLNALMELFFGLGRAAGVLAASLVTLTNPLDALKFVLADAAGRQAILTDSFKAALGAADANTAAVAKNTTAVKSLADTSALTEKAVADYGKTSITSAEAQSILAKATATTTGAVGTQGNALIQLQAALAGANKEIEAQIIAAEKNAKATQEQGKTLVELAKLSGDRVTSLQAELRASEANSAALDKAAQKHRTQTELLIAERDAIIKQAQSEAEGVKGREQAIAAIQQKIEKSQAETGQAEAAARASKLEIEQRKLAIQTLGDNSAQVDKLREAMIASRAVEQQKKVELDAGKISQEEYNKAVANANNLEARYKDALQDTTIGIKAKATLEESQLRLTQSGLNVQQQAYNSLAQQARASAALAKEQGDLYAATENMRMAQYYEIQAKDAQIKATKVDIEVKKASAKAALEVAEAEKTVMETKRALGLVQLMSREHTQEEVDAYTRETDALRKLAEAGINQAKAKQGEVDAMQLSIPLLEQEKSMMLQRQEAAGANAGASGAMASATRESASASEVNAGALDRETEAIKRQTAAKSANTNMANSGLTADGFAKNKDGSTQGTFTNSIPMDKIFSIQEKMQKGTLTAEDLADAQAAVEQAKNANEYLRGMKPTDVGLKAATGSNASLLNTQRALAQVQQLVDEQNRQNSTTGLNAAQTKKAASIQSEIEKLRNAATAADQQYQTQLSRLNLQISAAERAGDQLGKVTLQLQKEQLQAQQAEATSTVQSRIAGLQSSLASTYNVRGAKDADKQASSSSSMEASAASNTAQQKADEAAALRQQIAEQQAALVKYKQLLDSGEKLSGTKNVNIVINGKKQTVRTDSALSADTLVSVLKQLEDAANSSSP